MDRIVALRASFERAADAERAIAMAAYMKDRFPFFGIPSPERRAIQKQVLGDWRPDAGELRAFARDAWALDEREHQYAACDLLVRHVKRLGPGDLPLVAELITTRPWWDTCDVLAARVAGPIADLSTMERWLASGDLWLERAAILHQLWCGGATDEAFLFECCLAHAASTEFFHRKAIGWALRQYARTAPDAVRAFVAEHEAELSGLSKREALKHL